jgi:translocation and assembly module TamA
MAHASDPQPYKVEFSSVGNRDIDAALRATSDLEALRAHAPVSPFGLISRARSDAERLKAVLESFGYYECDIVMKINGAALSDPSLGAALAALPAGTAAQVFIIPSLGTLYTLRRIDVDGEVPLEVDAAESLGLKFGQPAIAASVLAAGERLQTSLQEHGYAFASVAPPIAYEAADAPALDLSFHVVTGRKVKVGEIRLKGLKRVHEALLRRILPLHVGDLFRPSAIERARQDILALNAFDQVNVQVAEEIGDTDGIPIMLSLTERARHTLSGNAIYSSDLGVSGGLTWTDRNVFGNAEQLTFAASAIDLGGSDATAVGYDLNSKLLMPDFLRRDQSLQLFAGALKQSLQAYDQTSKSVSATLNRKLSSVWSISAGVAATYEHVTQVGMVDDYTLFAWPLTTSYDSTDLVSPLEDPRHGYRGSVSLTPTLSSGTPHATFLIVQMKLAAFFDMGNWLPVVPGRSILAVRALAGVALGAGDLSLPPDQRFYAGGSGTVRGYKYQGVGPTFAEDPSVPTGGTKIAAATVEMRQRIRTHFGAVAFVDMAEVSGSAAPAPDDLRFGAGVGLRYYTPIGPIRIDIAVPVNRRKGMDDSFEFYVGLGQAF